MKKIIYALIISCIILSGCETTQEITVNKAGGGTLTNTTDMSSAMAMVKQFGAQQTSGSDKLNLDTSLALASFADSIAELKPEEKELIKKGSWSIKVNTDDEKFTSVLKYPFEKAEQVNTINNALITVIEEKIMNQVAKSGATLPPGMDEKPKPGEQSSIDDYFELKISDGVVEKKLKKEKYADIENDRSIMGLKNFSGMGATITNNYIINLPAPAKKVEGKLVKLSGDKKKVTLTATSDDFFDDPSKFEYRIEY
jgi:hypothetical protein